MSEKNDPVEGAAAHTDPPNDDDGRAQVGDAERKATKVAYEAADRSKGSPLPRLDFATFIFSLNSSALVHLGLLEDPATGVKEQQLPLAKQTIDILGMLEQKTRGNLEDEEDRMLKNLLYDLRILYVREKR